jgi:PAS domain S-box-containing protein
MPDPFPAASFPDGLLRDVLATSLVALLLVRPVYGPDGTSITDFSLKYLNPEGQRMTGLPERPGGTVLTCFPHTGATGVFAYYRRAFEAGEIIPYEVNYQADGLNNYFRFQARRSGEWLVVSFTDTADQDRSAVEQALRESQAREQEARAEAERQRNELRTFVEQAPVAVAIYRGPEHRVELANATALAIWGRTLPEVLGRPVFEALPEAAVPEVVAHFDRVYATGQAHTVYEQRTVLNRHGQPQEVYWNFVFQPDVQPDGRIVGIRSVGTDVSAQVRARQQVQGFNETLEARVAERTQQLAATQAQVLAAAERRVQEREQQQREVQLLFQQAPMAIVVLRGPAFIIEQVNEEAEAIWGRTAAQVLGRPHFEAVPDAAGQGFEALLAGILETGEAVVLHEVPVQLDRAHTGLPNQGYYSIIFKPLRDENQRVARIAIMWTESTDQVRARQQVLDLNAQLARANEALAATNHTLAATNEALATANQELQASNAQLARTNVDLDTFVYTASHDLKAPIANIESIVHALRSTLPAAAQQEPVVTDLLGLLDTTVARFQLTIAQLTDISRLQRAHTGPAEPVHLAAVVAAVQLDLAPQMAAAGTRLTLEVAPEVVVCFSPANLRSIVYNLLSNAVKYRAPSRPSCLRVHVEPLGSNVVLTVQDNGLGMSEVQQRQLFGLFQRLHTHVEGTGVGLYITKRLIENAGGTIAVHSQPGVGTTFAVTFPA